MIKLRPFQREFLKAVQADKFETLALTEPVNDNGTLYGIN